MITGRQIKAARALMDWDAADLAGKTGLSRETVSNIENDLVQARGGSIEKIVQAFASCGIEFLDDTGVRKKPTGIDVYNGPEQFNEFNEFLYEHLKAHGGDVCCSIYDDMQTSKHRKNPELHRQRMKELADRGDVTFRILTTKSNFVSYGYAEFKWLPEQEETPTGFYAFGDCLALMSFVDPRSPHVVVIRSSPLAEGYRQSFDIAWKNAQQPPQKHENTK